jgi:hypothetical protein
MNKIKYLKEKHIALGSVLSNGETYWATYRPYELGELPTTFGCIEDPETGSEGKPEWFNHKGLTYIQE